jgi:hypothetical protein
MNNVQLAVEEVQARVDGGIADDTKEAIFQLIDEGIVTEDEGAEVAFQMDVEMPE